MKLTNPHILLATDLSADCERVAEQAASLARQSGSTLHVLHVLPVWSWKVFGTALVTHPLISEEKMHEAARLRLKNLADVCARNHGISVVTHIDTGLPHECIAAYLRTRDIGLVVMGPHAGTLLGDLFVGATALKTLRRIRQPAFIAMSGMHEPCREVLVGVDFSEASRAALEFAVRFAPQARLHVLHVYDVPYQGMMVYAGVEPQIIDQYRRAAADEALRALHEFLSGMPESERMQPSVAYGPPARTILEQADALSAELVVMGKQGRSTIGELLLGSVTEEVLYQLDRDLLLVAEQPRA